MKKAPTVILIILLVWFPYFFGAFDKDKPASSTSLRNSNPEILANWDALETALAQDHEFSTGGTNSGKHEVLTMEEEASAGASATNEGHLQVIDGGTQPELAFTSEDGDELQLTKDGDLFSSDGLQVTLTSTFTGAITANDGITLGAGDDLIGSATSDITFNTNKFTVAGASGDTIIAGTLGVTGIATLGDGSTLATTAAPAAGTAEIANAKYVDDQIAANLPVGGTTTSNDSESNAMLKAQAYKAQTAGFAYARVAEANVVLTAFLGTTNDPAGAGINLVSAGSSSTANSGVTIFVPKDQFFEFTSTGTVTINWTPLISGGGAPIDQG